MRIAHIAHATRFRFDFKFFFRFVSFLFVLYICSFLYAPHKNNEYYARRQDALSAFVYYFYFYYYFSFVCI